MPRLDEPPPPLVAADDPRTQEDWFVRLPPATQDKMREQWRRERQWEAERQDEARRRRRRHMIEPAILLPVVLVFVDAFLLGSFWHLLGLIAVAAAAGAAVGAIVGHLPIPGRFSCALLGAAAYLSCQLAVLGFQHSFLALICFFFGLLLATTTFAAWGTRLEFRD